MAIKRFICYTLKEKIVSIIVKWLSAFSCVWTLLILKEIVLRPFVELLQQSHAAHVLRHLSLTPLPSLCPLDLWEAGITASKVSSLPLLLLMLSQMLLSPWASCHRIFSVSKARVFCMCWAGFLTADAPGSQQRALLPITAGFWLHVSIRDPPSHLLPTQRPRECHPQLL